jgi:tRNA wybutosine-synthesizing protein 4
VLIFGGCTIGGKVLDDWQLWDKDHGWRKLQAESSSLVPRFGSSLIATGSAHGMIMGGMDDTGRIIEEASAWSINDSLSIKFTPISYSGVASVARFGAHLVPSRWGNLLVGGVSSLGVVSKGEEILVLTPRMEAKSLKVFTQSVPRPLLIGSIAVTVAGGDVLIIGGGAACFSFGSIMNMHWYALQGVEHSGNVGQEDIIPHFQRLTKDDLHSRNPLSAGAALKSLRQFQRTKASGNNQTLELHDGPPRRSDSCYSMNRSFLANSSDVTKVSSMTLTGSEAMSDFSQPTLLLLKEGAFARTAEWNIDFLAAKIGHETVVSIHDSQGPHMKFGGEGRNIRYNSLPFGQFKVLLDHGYHCYLRSLNCSSNLEVPADFWSDFPGLRDDFKLPVFLKDAFGISDTTFHSAILRVSGDVTMWVHYDVMSNLLFQVSGSKQVLLFPPEDVIKLGFEPGKTASPLNVFEELEKRYHGDENQPRPSLDFLNGARPHGVILREGEVLFIPRFWAHATAPDAASHPSIAINVFWRDLDPKSYSSRLDVYGNLDLWCYEHGRQKIQRAATILCGNSNTTDRKKQAAAISQYLQGREMSDQTMIPDVRSVGLDALRKLIRANLPTDVSRFYLLRLADELVKLVEQDGISVEDP